MQEKKKINMYHSLQPMDHKALEGDLLQSDSTTSSKTSIRVLAQAYMGDALAITDELRR